MKRFNLNFEMRKKLSTQIEKRERERDLEMREEENL